MMLCGAVLGGFLVPPFGANFGWAPFRSIFLFFAGHYAYRVYNDAKGKKRIQKKADPWDEARQAERTDDRNNQRHLNDGGERQSDAQCLTVEQTRLFQTLGARSYSIYISHILVLEGLGTAIRAFERFASISLHRSGSIGGVATDILSFGPSW